MTRFVLLHHELTRLAQAPRTTLFRCAFLLTIIFFAAASVPWGAAAPRVQAAFASLFPVFYWCEMLFAIFVVPALVAADIPGEREKGTLELLLACPQSERDILLGKLGSQVAQAGVLLAAPFPLAFAAVALGGIRLDRALMVCVSVALTALLTAAIALRVSVVSARSSRASMRAVVLSGGIVLATSFAGAWLMTIGGPGFSLFVGMASVSLLSLAWAERRDGRPSWVGVLAYLAGTWMAFTFSSLVAAKLFGVAAALVPDPENALALCPWVLYTQAALDVRPPPTATLVATWTLHLFTAVLAIRWLLSPGVAEKLSSKTRAPEETEGRPLSARTGGVKGPKKENLPAEPPAPPRKAKQVLSRPGRKQGILWEPRLPIRGNPVYWRESIQLTENENSHLRFWVAAVAVLFAVPALSVDPHRNALWGGTHDGIVVEVFLLCLLIALHAAGTLAHEVERGTLSLLVSTGYRPSRIVAGKLRAAVTKSWPVLVVVSVHLSAIVLDLGFRGIALAGVCLLTASSVAGLAAGASWWSRRQRVALPIAVVLPFAVWILPSFLKGIFPGMEEWFIGSDPFSIMRAFLSYRGGGAPAFGHAATFLVLTVSTAIVPVALVCLGIERRMRA